MSSLHRVALSGPSALLALGLTAPLSAQPAPVATVPVATAPVATAPVATTPVATAPVATTPVATTPVATAPVALSPEHAITLALQQNPGLQASALSAEQAAARARSQEGSFPWYFQADGGYTHTESPSIGFDRQVVTSKSDAIGLGAQVDKTFPAGTGVQLRVDGERYDSRRPVSTVSATGGADTVETLGYDMSARASVSQPLLQGRGRDVNLAPLHAARIQRTQAERSRDLAASELVRDVLVAYWETWYASRSVEIEKDARALALEQRRAAEARRDAGALAPVDVLSFSTREAELWESVVAAEATARQRRLNLERLLGGGALAGELTGSPPEQVRLPTETAIVAALQAHSPELAELNERIRLAELQAKTATEPYRARLDLTAYGEARGLGRDVPGPAMEQVATLTAVSGHVGLLYRTRLDGRQRSAARAEADLAVRIAKSNLEAARQRILSSTLSLANDTRAAQARYEAAQHTAAITARLLEAEQLRFQAGTSTPLQVQEAEDSVRQARQRVVRARVDLVKAEVELHHAMGVLLDRYVATDPRG